MEDEKRAQDKKGEKYTEHLSHFRCYFCRKWWSVGDAPERHGWYCPWCGKYQEMKTKISNSKS